MGKENCVYSIVVPVYNEEDSIIPFYERTKNVIESMNESFEIVFINDGSKDKTLSILIELNRKDERVKVVNFSRNFGKENAVTAGIDFAIGDAVIPIDVDLQDPPEVIVELSKKWKEGFDVVYATRSERKGETFIKKSTASLFYRLISSLTKINIPKDTGDFRLIDRKVVDALKELKETNRFMKGLFSWVGFNQTGILYQREPRFAGKTKWNYFKLFNFALEGITSFSNAPLKIASFFGFFISFLAIVYGSFFLVKTLVFGIDVPGYPSLIVIMLFLGGIQLICIGIIGEYLGRIYSETKKRPLYLVKSIYGIKNKSRDK
jgi:polyisoprenyl-phosphate glycosyltransferase